jgi:protein O-GlcNAc transferase
MRKNAQAAQQALAAKVTAANTALVQQRLCETEHLCRQILAQAPQTPEVHNNLGSVLKEQGRLPEAHAAFEQALALRPEYASAHSNLLFTLQYAPGQTLAGLRSAHEDWARRQLRGMTFTNSASFARKSEGPITIGLVSPDFYAHPVGVFLLPWLERHDQGCFRLIAYADSERDDLIASRIRAAVDIWRPIAGQDDKAVAKQVAEDRVDILIDLAGHTAGNRLKLFAQRAAPLQVSWLGYSATTGVPAMDAVLMDAYTAPPGVEKGFTEQLIRFDGLRFCYAPPEYAPAVTPALILQKGYVTFGSFNNLAKVTPEVIETWAAILQAVPNARLMLKWKSLGDSETRDRLVAAFVQRGVASARIECRGWSSHPQMLREYGDIDIALDPFPFSGGLTSCDALYMGVPVLTLHGELPISRQTGSFLDSLGLTDWIASSRENYIAKAVSLAGDADLLESLRQNLRAKMLASRLCDGTSYARAIESVLSKLHEAKCPPHITTDINMKTFLHIGCGPKRKDQTTKGIDDELRRTRSATRFAFGDLQRVPVA